MSPVVSVESEAVRQSIQDSDAKILDHSSQEDGFMVFPANLMPDGEPFRGQLPPEGPNTEVLMSWVSNVRGQYNARKERKDAEASERGKVLRDAEESRPAITDERGRSLSSAAETVSNAQEELGTYLESQIALLSQQLDEQFRAISYAETHIEALREDYERTKSDLVRTRSTLLHYRELSDDTSEVRREDGEENN